MTRSHDTNKYSNMPQEKQERHYQRSGLFDIRGNPKKAGAGHGNWGVTGDEVNELDQQNLNSNENQAELTSGKIQVMHEQDFLVARRASEEKRPQLPQKEENADNQEASLKI
ncbi:uncharacterized protein VTP21DRAFT_788 [Calcarisporiella thermophila]|uniref:uncharacterized protein n=1 Tax=Calcarisporiella thermophila TaxID=911321 RepID=UPI00374354E1